MLTESCKTVCNKSRVGCFQWQRVIFSKHSPSCPRSVVLILCMLLANCNDSQTKVQTLGNDSSFHQQLCGANSTRKNRCHLAQNLTWTPWKIAMFEGDSVSKPREFGVLFCIFFVNYSLIKLQNFCITSLDDTKWYNHHPSKADQSSLFRKHITTPRGKPVVVCLEDRWALARAVPVIRWWALARAISCGGDGGFESTSIILTMVYGRYNLPLVGNILLIYV